MSLRAQAEADLAVTLEASGDFGEPITIIDPNDVSNSNLFAQTGNIGQGLDPETGLSISVQHAHCSIRIASLIAEGYTELPKSISSPTMKPWRIRFDGPSSALQWYKVKESRPDRTIGLVTCVLELWIEL